MLSESQEDAFDIDHVVKMAASLSRIKLRPFVWGKTLSNVKRQMINKLNIIVLCHHHYLAVNDSHIFRACNWAWLSCEILGRLGLVN